MPQLSLDSQVDRARDHVIDRIVEGEALLIHLDSGNYFSLNDVGTRVWENMDGNRTIRDLVGVISVEYDVTAEVAQQDVLSLVDDLVKEGLAIVV